MKKAVILLLLLIAATWFMTFIPILGQSVVILALPLLSSIIFGYVHVDYSFSVLGRPIKQRAQWAQQNWPYLLGSGVYALIFPIVYFLYPAFIVGSLLDQRDTILNDTLSKPLIKEQA